MGLLLDETPARSRRRACGLSPHLAGPHGADLRTMLANPKRWSAADVSRALRRVLGDDTPGIGPDVVGRHRREECACRS